MPEPHVSTDTSLLNLVRVGDPDGWRRLVALYGPLVYGWARGAGLRGDDAADVVQDVFASVAVGITRFRRDRPGDSFRGWLWTITRNKIRDHARRRVANPEAAGGTDALQQLLQAPGAEPPSRDEPTGSAGVLQRAVELVRAEFEERTWQAFWRVVVDGKLPIDVAEELGITANAVYLARSRVLRRLRETLADETG